MERHVSLIAFRKGNMSEPSPSNDPQLREELVAYLDGELDSPRAAGGSRNFGPRRRSSQTVAIVGAELADVGRAGPAGRGPTTSRKPRWKWWPWRRPPMPMHHALAAASPLAECWPWRA